MYDYGTFLYESHICSKYEAMILNWLHNGAENFVQIICKFQKVSCYRNETARSNVLPTINKHFNSIALDRFELTLLIYVVNNWNCYYRYCWKMSQRSPEIKIIVIYFKNRCRYCSLLKWITFYSSHL